MTAKRKQKIKPYWSSDDSLCVIYCGDCREIIPQIEIPDCIVTDPPYGISYDSSHTKYKNGISRKEADWDVEAFDPSHLLALNKPTILWGGNCFSSRLPDFPGWLCWQKTARNNAQVRQADMELAWTNCVKRSRHFQLLWIGAYRDEESGQRNVHPTQKPVSLMKWCLGLVSGSVLDPYCGSGTTGVACRILGRPFVGIELDKHYCDIAVQRIGGWGTFAKDGTIQKQTEGLFAQKGTT